MRKKDEEKKIAIYHAAIGLVSSQGFAATSMSKIAKAAGVSPSTIYVYFENKEDMINKLYIEAKKKFLDAVLSGILGVSDIKEALKLIINNLFNYALEHQIEFMFTEQFANSPYISKISREQTRELFSDVIRLFEDGKKAGVVKDIEMEIAFSFIIAPIAHLIKAHHSGNLIIDKSKILKSINMAWDGIKC